MTSQIKSLYLIYNVDVVMWPKFGNYENIDNNLLNLYEPALIKTLLFGSNSFDTNANTNVLNATIEYLLSTQRFEEPLFQWIQ